VIATVVLAVIVTAIFAALGSAKVPAVARMRVPAEKSDFSVSAYRGVGALEPAGAAGVALGPFVPPLGVLAAGGLLLLLTGALIVHLQHRAQPHEPTPAALVACYATTLPAETPQSRPSRRPAAQHDLPAPGIRTKAQRRKPTSNNPHPARPQRAPPVRNEIGP
jgi:hypothetical protein